MFCLYPGCHNKTKKFDPLQAKKHVWEQHLKQSQEEFSLDDPKTCTLVHTYLKEDKKEPLFCTWKDCGFIQNERDYWKAKRHVWDRHLRETLYKMLSKDGPSPNYGSLSAEDKKKVNPDLEVFISTKKTFEVYTPKIEKPLPPVERPVTKKRERDDCGTLEWNPDKVSNIELDDFIQTCCKLVQDSDLNLQEVYNVVHKHDYDLEKAKKYVKQNTESIQNQKLILNDMQCLKNNLKVTTDPKAMSSITKKTYQYVYEFLKDKRESYEL